MYKEKLKTLSTLEKATLYFFDLNIYFNQKISGYYNDVIANAFLRLDFFLTN